MASEIVGDGESSLWSRTFMAIMCTIQWTPVIGEVLPVKREQTNNYDCFAVAVMKDGEVVGHVPRTLSKTSAFFLRYDDNVVFRKVTGERMNRGVQLGVDVST